MELKLADRPNDLMPLPQGWTHHPLKAGIILQSGHHVLAIYCNTKGAGVPYLTGPADFPEETIQQTKFTERPTTLCEQGDILVTVKGSGSGSMVKSDATYCISRQLMAIRVRDWDKDFIYYSLLQNASQIKAASTGLIPGLSRSDILDQTLPIPPLPEQRVIAAALNDVDALISGLDQLIAKKRDLKQAAMQHLLTGKRRLPGFHGEWEEMRIGEFTDCNAGGTPSTVVPSYWGGSIRWMSSGELNLKRVEEVAGRITEEGLRNSSTKLIPIKCVLIGLAGQGKTRGTVAMNFVELCTNQSIAAIFPSEAFVPEYLYYILDTRYDELRELSSGGGGRGGLNLTLIKSISVPLPSIPEQTAIATVLTDMDAEIAALEQRRDKTRDLKQGMMQELLTGRIRLV